jgi:hypothetical protein
VTYIYRQLDIALSMNQRILIKCGENLYSDSGMIRKNQTRRFFKPNSPIFLALPNLIINKFNLSLA